jgi:hypothetical protein
MAVVINGNGTVTGISVGGLPDGIVDSGTLATNSVDSAELVDGAVDDSHMASISGRKNLIINGAMNVHQRGGTTTSEEYVLDRFRLGRAGGTRTASQEVITSGDAFDAGFRNSFRITNTTAGSTTATDYAEIQHHIESQNIATSGWNYTDSAKDITLSFWAKSSVGQTFNLFIKNDDTGYRYTSTFTLTANTWTRITKTLSGDSNLVLNNDNGKGLLVSWQVYQGTNWTTSTPNNDTWKASGNPDDMTTTWNTTTGATFDLTGVQVELGSTATDFEHRSYGEELALCQRYYINRKINAVGAEYGSYDNLIWMYQYDMRASPSFSIPSGNISDDFVGGTFSYTPTGNYIDSEGLRISYYLGSTSILGGRSYSADVVFDAEL